MLGKKSACQVRQDRQSNHPNYFVFHFILVYLFYGHTKRLSPDPKVGLGARLHGYWHQYPDSPVFKGNEIDL